MAAFVAGLSGNLHDDGKRIGIAERFLEPVRENRILLYRRHGATAPEQAFGEHAETGTDLENGRSRRALAVVGRQRRVQNRFERVPVDEKVLAEHLVRMESVLDAPVLDL